MQAQAATLALELRHLTQQNTVAVCTATSLAHSQHRVEAEVLSQKARLFGDQLLTRKAAVAERHSLVTAVNERAEQLQTLWNKVNTLRRKDTALHQ